MKPTTINQLLVTFASIASAQAFVNNVAKGSEVKSNEGKQIQIPMYLRPYTEKYDVETIEEVEPL